MGFSRRVAGEGEAVPAADSSGLGCLNEDVSFFTLFPTQILHVSRQKRGAGEDPGSSCSSSVDGGGCTSTQSC